MTAGPLTPEDFAGWRYTCTEHQWMSNSVPCPAGDGTGSGLLADRAAER